MKTPLQLLLPALAAALLGSGCATRQYIPSISLVDPTPDGYFTDEKHDFNSQMTLDPQQRKFRIEYLWVEMNYLASHDSPKAAIKAGTKIIFFPYMGLREQAQSSDWGKFCTGGKGSQREEAAKGVTKSIRSHSPLTLEWIRYKKEREFVKQCNDVVAINGELSRRFPNLFTTDPSGFPLTILLCGAFGTTRGPEGVVQPKTIYEAWLIGIPEHADLKNEYDPDTFLATLRQSLTYAKDLHLTIAISPLTPDPRAFPQTEAFTDPYDAFAASLFKLSPEQWESLDPANPDDYLWLSE